MRWVGMNPPMHRFSSYVVLRRFRLAAWLLVFATLLIVGSLGLLAHGLHVQSRDEVLIGLVAAGAGFVTTLIQLVVAHRVRCPLCMMPPLGYRACQKNRRARRLLGSYRMRVAGAAIFRDHFQCPYCGESTRLEVRERQPMAAWPPPTKSGE